jgi:gamma-glutamylcyclotransferase (GGCT)/AIG2-like uncharacterized protein YtfP
MIKNDKFPIKVFVFGTLLKGERLDYYMDGSIFAGNYYTEGQLMQSETGSAYIDFSIKNTATFGELYYMNFPGLLRIDHLESRSGEFPKGYDLDLTQIWKANDNNMNFNLNEADYAFVYKRRNEPQQILSGDWRKRYKPINEINAFLLQNSSENINSERLIFHMLKYFKK